MINEVNEIVHASLSCSHWHSLCSQSWPKPSMVQPNEKGKRNQEIKASCMRRG